MRPCIDCSTPSQDLDRRAGGPSSASLVGSRQEGETHRQRSSQDRRTGTAAVIEPMASSVAVSAREPAEDGQQAAEAEAAKERRRTIGSSSSV